MPILMTTVVREKVKQMAADKGIKYVMFTTKAGVPLPNVNWLT